MSPNEETAGQRLGRIALALDRNERLAALGALAIPLSLLFPWYGFKLGSPLSATGFESFNFAHLGLLMTAAAAMAVVLAPHLGIDLPRPLTRAPLLIAAGAWAGVLVAYLMADRPDLLAGIGTIGGVRLRYGVFVAAGGAAAIGLAGLRIARLRDAEQSGRRT